LPSCNSVAYALFVSREPNSRNSLSLFSNVWQSSGNLVKEKLIPVNKKSLLYPQESVFLSLSKEKHFPIFTDKTHLTPLCISIQKQLKSKKICHSVSHSPVNRFWKSHSSFQVFFPSNFSIILQYYFLYVFIFFIFFRSARIIAKNLVCLSRKTLYIFVV